MPIEFPQQSLLVNDIAALVHGGVIRGSLLELGLLFFGHSRREKREQRGDMGGGGVLNGVRRWARKMSGAGSVG